MAKKTYSCSDLHHSLYLAPNQIRTCCKRFFIDGKQRGDVVLLDQLETTPTIKEITHAKQELYSKINTVEKTTFWI